MLKMCTLIGFLCLVSTSIAFAQADSLKQHAQFSFSYANDFFTASDRYFTQGIKMELIHPAFNKFPFSKICFGNKKSGKKYSGILVQQECFTPRSIRHEEIQQGERPYAAFMFLSYFMISINAKQNQRITSKADLGVMGPCAVCEQEQKGIHHALNNIQPLGWQHQLKNDVIINYSVGIDKIIFATPVMEIIALTQARFGTIYTDVGAGSMIRFGKMNPIFTSYELMGSFRNRFQAFFFLKGFTKIVGYNAGLQGGLFTQSEYHLRPSEITRLVSSMESGVTVLFRKFGFSYILNWISPEFNQGLFHAWGKCNLYFRL